MKSFRDVILGSRESRSLLSVLFELTYACNWDCFFCYNDLSLSGRTMTVDDYRRVLTELAEMQVLNVTLSGGEPLVHQDFFAIGAMCKELGFVTRLKSNAHALRGAVLDRVINEVDPQMIDVSLHGACAKTHEKQVRVAGSFDRLIANIREMKSKGLLVKVNSTLTKWNENEVEAMYDLADDLGVPLQFDPEVTIRDDGDEEPLSIAASVEGLKHFEAIKYARTIGKRVVELGSLPSQMKGVQNPEIRKRNAYEEKQYHNYCGAGTSSLTIDPVGNVYPCVQWRTYSGNIHEQSIQEIWTGSTQLERVREIQPQILNWVKENDNLPRVRGFCPGAAEQQSGSALEVHDNFKRRVEILDGESSLKPIERSRKNSQALRVIQG